MVHVLCIVLFPCYLLAIKDHCLSRDIQSMRLPNAGRDVRYVPANLRWSLLLNAWWYLCILLWDLSMRNYTTLLSQRLWELRGYFGGLLISAHLGLPTWALLFNLTWSVPRIKRIANQNLWLYRAFFIRFRWRDVVEQKCQLGANHGPDQDAMEVV